MWYPVGNDKKTGRKFYERFFQDLSTIVPEWETTCFFDDDGFRIRLVPFEEDIYGSWEKDRLCVSGKTNSAGPGYHAWLIELLDELKIKPLEVEDETGYYETRDYTALQNSMMNWLKGLSGHLLEMSSNGDYKNIGVSMPIDRMPDNSSHFACCPLGYFDKDFFTRANEGMIDGSEFFIWWNKQRDAMFFKNCALNLIWGENNWLPPETDEERNIIHTTLACLEKAYVLDSSQNYPCAEWLELARLIEEEKMAEQLQTRFDVTEAATLGYRRGNIISSMGGWKITHSGKMHFEQEPDGTAVWWNDSLTFRSSVITVQFNSDVENKSETFLQSALQNESDYEPFSLRNRNIHAAIQHSQYEENGELLWQTRLLAALDNELLILSVYYEDEADRDSALEICTSVAR